MATPRPGTGPRGAIDSPVRTLCRALQDDETCQPDVRDAEQGGNRVPARFFRDVRQEGQRRAERAEWLLARGTRRRHPPQARLVSRPVPLDRHPSPTPPGRADHDDPVGIAAGPGSTGAGSEMSSQCPSKSVSASISTSASPLRMTFW